MTMTDEYNPGHDRKSIVCPRGLDGPGVIECECGWHIGFGDNGLKDARLEHARHQYRKRVGA
jgi:hypothetical protein